LPVFAGNAEINDIVGRRPPRERARIVNWSREGMLLRVPSPRRRFVFFRREPVLQLSDALSCTLRLPPQYADIRVDAAVVRVERAKDDADLLEVGCRFDPATNPAVIETMARLLEPRLRAPSVRVPAAKKSQRLEKQTSQKLEMRASERVEKPTSQRLEKKTSQRLEKPTSQRLEKPTSQRLEKSASQRLEKKASQRLEKRASQRLERPVES